MAKRKGKTKRPGVIRRAVGRWAWRKVHAWAAEQRRRIRKTFKPRVVIASAKQRQWERQFPDARRTPPLPETIERVEEWMATFTAELDNGWRVPFQVDIHNREPLRQAAYDAAEIAHGAIARTREIVDIEPTNELAENLMLEET